MLESWRRMGASEDVPDLRTRRVLRLLKKQARDKAFSPDKTSDHALYRAGRELGLVLCRPSRAGSRLTKKRRPPQETQRPLPVKIRNEPQ